MESVILNLTTKIPTPSYNKLRALSPCSSQFYKLRSSRTLFITINCKIKTSQDSSNSKTTSLPNKISVSEGAPPLSEDGGDAGDGKVPAKPLGNVRRWKRLPKKVLAVLSNLPLAIGEMFTIAGLMAIGMSQLLCRRVSSLNEFILGLVDADWSFLWYKFLLCDHCLLCLIWMNYFLNYPGSSISSYICRHD